MGPRSSGRGIRRDTATPIPDETSEHAAASAHEFYFTVQFPSRLRPHRVESIHVCVNPVNPIDRLLDISRKKADNSLPVRLVVPGALITPAERIIEPSPFGPAEAVFHATAVADGELSGACVEVLRQGQVETIELPLRGERPGTVRWLLVLAILVPLFLHLPVLWPDAARDASIERAIREWLPNVPGLSASVARLAQGGYDFFAESGKGTKLSFFAFVGLTVAAAVWGFVCRQTTVKVTGQTFRHVLPPKSGDIPAFLTPASIEDVAIPSALS